MTARIASPRHRHRHGDEGLRARLRHARPRGWARAATAALAAVALVVTGVSAAQSAPATIELLVNSLDTTADANPGDGVCEDANGVCTLRAAIQESNTLNAAPGEVRIGVDPDFAGGRINLTTTTSTWMRTTTLSSGGSITGDSGAIFEVTAPVEIDLEHRLTAAPVDTLDGPGAALFHLNGDSITVRGVTQSWTGETTFYVGPSASNILITDGSIQTVNYYPERFFLVRGGASQVTLSDFSVQGYGANDSEWGWGFVDGATTAATQVSGLVIENMTYQAELTGTCNAASAAGCTSTPLYMRQQYVSDLRFSDNTIINMNRANDSDGQILDMRQATIGSLVVSGNVIQNPRVYSGEALIEFGVAGYGANITDFAITDNVFTDVTAASEEMNGMIRLPANKSIAGTGLISGNVITALDAQMHAIYWDGPYSDSKNTTASGVVIENNHFDGWGDNSSRSTIRMYQTGAVTVRQNTFGTETGTQANTVTEEGTISGSYATTMLSNWSYGANGKMNTWYPTARTSGNVQASNLTARACTIEMEVAPPSDSTNSADITSSHYPTVPTTLDVYWTASRTAEVFLESVVVSAEARTTLTVELPLPGDERLAHLADGATVPVDPVTGVVSGGLRLQTQDPNVGATTASSQFSRVALIDGTCAPMLTLDQADDQNDPTLARDLHYTLTSTMSLDPSSLTAEDFGLTAVATADTIDAARLNPRVVSITPVAGSNDTVFTVIVRVDDSATVTTTLGAGGVQSTLGLSNPEAAASTDNAITFTNPLVANPARFTLVTGEEVGKDYTLSIRAGAPSPAAELLFTSTLDQAGQDHGVVLSTSTPTITVGGESTAPITVTAAAGDVTANTPVVITHTVSSADPTYDGLVVPSVSPHLFSTDPTIEITKRAYTGVTDSSSPAQIEATGTPALSGERLMDGQAVCWVYTVTNISADDWATELTDIRVTDSDTRLGTAGLIGTVPSLGLGESHQLSACAVLIPTDTTAGAP